MCLVSIGPDDGTRTVDQPGAAEPPHQTADSFGRQTLRPAAVRLYAAPADRAGAVRAGKFLERGRSAWLAVVEQKACGWRQREICITGRSGMKVSVSRGAGR